MAFKRVRDKERVQGFPEYEDIQASIAGAWGLLHRKERICVQNGDHTTLYFMASVDREKRDASELGQTIHAIRRFLRILVALTGIDHRYCLNI